MKQDRGITQRLRKQKNEAPKTVGMTKREREEYEKHGHYVHLKEYRIDIFIHDSKKEEDVINAFIARMNNKFKDMKAMVYTKN